MKHACSAWMRLLVLICCGCADLPEIGSDECGNRVIDPSSEDCDTFAPAGMACRQRNAIAACHFDCSPQPNGSRPRCPDGWGCDRDDICRAPSGDFERPLVARVDGAWSLSAADFDGDGRDELLAQSVPNDLDEAMFGVHYFDREGVLSDTRAFARRVRSPLATDLSDDGRSDIAFASAGVALLRGRGDRSLVPEAFSSYRIPEAGVRTVSIGPGLIDGVAVLLVLTSLAGAPGIYAVDGRTQQVLPRAALAAPIEELAGDPSAGPIFEGSPCHQLAYALRGATSFELVDACTRDLESGQTRWRDRAETWTIALEPALAIEAGPQIGDVDGDGHQDVLVGSTRETYVAFGDGVRLRPAVPYHPRLSADGAPANLPMPLALGDFSGDARADLVLADRLLVSSSKGPTDFAVSQVNRGAAWSVATIADLNGNGMPDVVVGSREAPGLDFFSGTGTPTLIAFHYPTGGPVALLGSGDFDGDSIGDVAAVARGPTQADEDDVVIAYGVSHQPPSAPKLVAQIRGAEYLTVNQSMGLFSHLGVSSSTFVDGRAYGVVTWLYGGPERVPIAPYDLLPQTMSDSVQRYVPANIVAGRFVGAPQRDLLALAGDPGSGAHRFWRVPTLSGQRGPIMLDGDLDPNLAPLEIVGRELRRVQVASTSADLDGDQRDEALWAMPTRDGRACGIAVYGTEGVEEARLRAHATILVERPCLDPQIAAVDVDADPARRPDLVLLTGARGAPDRALFVLWNDGFGNFDALNAAQAHDPSQSPQAFAALSASPTRPFSLAYVTDSALATVAAPPLARIFEPPRTLAMLRQGRGIAAGDVNGDGMTDLAVADAGDLSVFLAHGVLR